MRFLLAICVCPLALGTALSQVLLPAAPAEQGTYLGVLVSPVPEVLYQHLPALPSGRGVVVTHVYSKSPGEQAGLKKFDILLRYDDKPIEDCAHFARLIKADKPERKLQLHLLRGGQETTAEATLATGPVLRVAMTGVPARVLPKDANPVSVAVTPLEAGKYQVTIGYLQEGKPVSVTHSGTSADIKEEVQKLPARVQDLAATALQRIFERQKDPASPPR